MSEESTPKGFDAFEYKPDLSANSRRLYLFNLTKLNDGKPLKDLKFLGKEDVLHRVENLKPNTRRTYLISIVSALRGRNEAKYKKLYKKFYDLLMGLNKELKDNTEKTEKVKNNWMEQDNVLDKQKEMESTLLPRLDGKKKLTESDYNDLLNLVVLSLYTLQQPRRNKDYADMLVVKTKTDEKTHNYLETHSWRWVFNNYKTQKKYAQQVIDIPEPLQKILKLYLKHHPKAKDFKKKDAKGEPFLVRYDGSPITTSPEMTRLLNKIFGKNIGCSMLRSIYLTQKYGNTLKEMKEDVTQMGTSTETAQSNYIKQ